MPPLDDSYPRMVAALAAWWGPAGLDPRGESAFETVLSAGFARAGVVARTDRVIEALSQSGWLQPDQLADAEPAEIVDLLREAGVKLTARAALLLKRLARWFVATFANADESDVDDEATHPTASLRQSLTAIRALARPRPMRSCWRWDGPSTRWIREPIGSSSATAGPTRLPNTMR